MIKNNQTLEMVLGELGELQIKYNELVKENTVRYTLTSPYGTTYHTMTMKENCNELYDKIDELNEEIEELENEIRIINKEVKELEVYNSKLLDIIANLHYKNKELLEHNACLTKEVDNLYV